jgi:hypothetical protein
VLSLLLPVVDATDGGLTRLWPLLILAGGLLVGFAWWEARTARRGRQPLLDPQLAHIAGYAPGLAIGLVYFVGFTGIWLVLAVFSRTGWATSRCGPAWPSPRSRSGWPSRQWSPAGWWPGWAAG